MKEKKDETQSTSSDRKVNPYKGLNSYSEADEDSFFGRNAEVENLFNQVRLNQHTLVHGKSGIGKTSLLNAGLFPRLRNEGFLPIPIRLNHSEEIPLKEQIRSHILAVTQSSRIEVRTKNEKKLTVPFAQDETFWEYFQRVRHFDPDKGKAVTPVLVFDQFEEFFTTGKQFNETDKDTLLDELYWLIENQFPPSLKERDLTADERRLWFSSSPADPEVRVIISLREDYLPDLIELKPRIPSIDRTLFRVIHLNGMQAKEIINMPGGIQEETVTEEILQLFYPDDIEETEKIPPDKLEVEPLILGLICYQIIEENKRRSFTKTHRNRILTYFYDSVMKEFPKKVEIFIEDNLLTEGGFRLQYRLQIGHPLEMPLQELVDRRILRRVHTGGKEYIEIIHDLLAPIIVEKRSRRGRKTKNLIIAALSGFLSLFIVLTWFAFFQKSKADKQYKDTQISRLTAEALLESSNDNTRAVRIAGNAYEMALPNPPVRTYKTLSDIAYSSVEKPFYTTILQHEKPVKTAVFSPDGSAVLTASENTAILWELGKKSSISLEHTAEVSSAVFSKDGTWILTAGDNGIVKIWDQEGNLEDELNCHKDKISSVVFSPDGLAILTSSWDNTAVLWDLGTKEPQVTLKHNDVVSSGVFSPKGDLLLTASWDKTAKVWDRQGRRILSLPHNEGVSSAVFSPNGKRILTASEDGSAAVWDLKENLLLSVKHNDAVTSAVFSPDGRWILTASRDGTAKVWNKDGNPIKNLTNNDGVYSAEFSPDGRRIVTASRNKNVKVWEFDSGFLTDLNLHKGKGNIAVFSPDDNRILTSSSDNMVRVWDLEGNLLTDSIKHEWSITNAEFSTDGRRVLTASTDGTAKLWDIKGNLIAKFEHYRAVSSAVFSPNGNRILTASMDRSVKLWNSEKECLLTLKHGEGVSSAVFLPDGHLILTAAVDGTLTIWNRKGEAIETFKHKGMVYSIDFSPDGRRILTASADGTVKIWDMQGRFVKTLSLHKAVVTSALFSKDGRRVLTVSDGAASAKLLDLDGKSLVSFDHSSGVYSAVFSPNGSRVLTASGDGTARIWNLEGRLLAELDKHKGVVESAVFSKNGHRVLTVSWDHTAKVWYTPEAIYDWLKGQNDKFILMRQRKTDD